MTAGSPTTAGSRSATPRSRQEEHGDRAAWPWLPGTIVEQCGPDEWQVCVEDRDVAVLGDGRPAPGNTASRNLYYPMCFRDSSEIRRPPPAVPTPGMPGTAPGRHPGRTQDHHDPGGAQGAVAVTGDRLITGAATVVLCVVAGSAVTVGSTRTFALAEGHGMDGTAALLVAVSLGGLIAGASLALLDEERGPGCPAQPRECSCWALPSWPPQTSYPEPDTGCSARSSRPGPRWRSSARRTWC